MAAIYGDNYNDPYKIIPLSLQDGSYRHILAWSKEERVYKDGSYEKLDLMEQFRLDPSGKVDGFKQWVAIDSVNFGRRFGGKFFGKKKENTADVHSPSPIETKPKP